MSESNSGFDQIGWYCPQCATFTHENCKMDGMAGEKHTPAACFIGNLAPSTERPLQKSDCCDAAVKFDETIDGQPCFRCCKCDKPCDALPAEQTSGKVSLDREDVVAYISIAIMEAEKQRVSPWHFGKEENRPKGWQELVDRLRAALEKDQRNLEEGKV